MSLADKTSFRVKYFNQSYYSGDIYETLFVGVNPNFFYFNSF